MSKALKQRGWTFVGPTICYSFMQSMGLVNDHVEECFRRKIVADLRKNLDDLERYQIEKLLIKNANNFLRSKNER